MLVSLDAEGVEVVVGDVGNPDMSFNGLLRLLDQHSRGTSRMITVVGFPGSAAPRRDPSDHFFPFGCRAKSRGLPSGSGRPPLRLRGQRIIDMQVPLDF